MSNAKLVAINPKSSLIIWKFLSKIDLLRAITREKGYLTHQDIQDHLDNATVEFDSIIDNIAHILREAGLKVYKNHAEAADLQSLQLKQSLQCSEEIFSGENKHKQNKQNATNSYSIQSNSGSDTVPASATMGARDAMNSITSTSSMNPMNHINALNIEQHKETSISVYVSHENAQEKLHDKKTNIILQQQKIAALERAIGFTQDQIKELKNEVLEVENALSVAKKEMINANLRLIFSIAAKYTNKGVSFFNLIREGKIGLMKAIDEFEYRSGHDFLTYASSWIHRAISSIITTDATLENNANNTVCEKGTKESEQPFSLSLEHLVKLDYLAKTMKNIDGKEDHHNGECYASA